MVRSNFPEPHGARDESTRHYVTAELAAMLAAARRHRGWSQREAARNIGVTYGMIGHLEHCRRAPSAALAERIIDAYRLDHAEAGMLRAEAVEDAGENSLFRQTPQHGRRLSMEAGSGSAIYGAHRGGRP